MEALLGSGMNIKEFCIDRERVSEWKEAYDQEDWNDWLDQATSKEKEEV